jgi:hypothetical protein
LAWFCQSESRERSPFGGSVRNRIDPPRVVDALHLGNMVFILPKRLRNSSIEFSAQQTTLLANRVKDVVDLLAGDLLCPSSGI